MELSGWPFDRIAQGHPERARRVERMAAPLNVLVVDDEPKICQILEQILVTRGCAVRIAANGLDALARFKEQPAEVVITDLKMPKMTTSAGCPCGATSASPSLPPSVSWPPKPPEPLALTPLHRCAYNNISSESPLRKGIGAERENHVSPFCLNSHNI